MTTHYAQKTSKNIPYTKYFEFIPYENWSLRHYDLLIINNYECAEKKEAHRAFYNAIHDINNDPCMSQEVRNITSNLLKNKRADMNKVSSLWNNASEGKEKKPRVLPDIDCFCPDIDMPLRANGLVDVLEVIKSAVRIFDPKTIALGSSRSYKSSNHLLVDSKCNTYVPRESVYDAEMYRILHNWLAKVYDFEITGQWHLEGMCNDEGYHHCYNNLMIKKKDDPTPLAVLELIATGSVSTLEKHFKQVFKYADKLRPLEVWIIHFSREDSIVSSPYWPCEEKGLNVVHFRHNKEFTNVYMSARFRNDIESLRELNSRLVLKIDKLRKKFTEIEAENTELKGEKT
ncbi:20012_t:CDS:2, partial [Racocetra persica]